MYAHMPFTPTWNTMFYWLDVLPRDEQARPFQLLRGSAASEINLESNKEIHLQTIPFE